MQSTWTQTALALGLMTGLYAFPAAADTLSGQLVDLSSVESRVTLQLDAPQAAKNIVSYQVAKDARWHICLQDSCIIRQGVDGFRAVNEYAEYGAYGIPHATYAVTLNLKENVATGLEVQLVPKVH